MEIRKEMWVGWRGRTGNVEEANAVFLICGTVVTNRPQMFPKPGSKIGMYFEMCGTALFEVLLGSIMEKC